MKSNWNKIVLTIVFCAFASIVAIADEQIQSASDNVNGMSQRFVWMAATTDQKEIQLGELALQKGDNSNVKSFAERIVSDHKNSCEKLQAIAEKEGLHFPGTNLLARGMSGQWDTNSDGFENPAKEKQDMDSPPHLASRLVSNANNSMGDRQMAVDWDSLSGVDFDRAFAKHMVAGHEKAIRQFEAASAGLQDADLKEYANNTLPVLRDHLRMAQDLESQIAGSSYGTTNNWTAHSNMDTNSVATAEPHHWWQFWKH